MSAPWGGTGKDLAKSDALDGWMDGPGDMSFRKGWLGALALWVLSHVAKLGVGMRFVLRLSPSLLCSSVVASACMRFGWMALRLEGGMSRCERSWRDTESMVYDTV